MAARKGSPRFAMALPGIMRRKVPDCPEQRDNLGLIRILRLLHILCGPSRSRIQTSTNMEKY
jgi:hypothetical protein